MKVVGRCVVWAVGSGVRGREKEVIEDVIDNSVSANREP